MSKYMPRTTLTIDSAPDAHVPSVLISRCRVLEMPPVDSRRARWWPLAQFLATLPQEQINALATEIEKVKKARGSDSA